MQRDAKYVYCHCVTILYPRQKNPCRYNINCSRIDSAVGQRLAWLMSIDEARVRRGFEQMRAERTQALEARFGRLKAIDKEIDAADKRIGGLMRAVDGEEDETAVATLREQVNAQKWLKTKLMVKRDQLKGEVAQSEISEDQICIVLSFA